METYDYELNDYTLFSLGRDLPNRFGKRVVRVVGPNFELPGFDVTFHAKNAIFGHFHPLFLCQISKKHSSYSKMVILTPLRNFWKIGAENVAKNGSK